MSDIGSLGDRRHPSQFLHYVGPESVRWWSGLDAFWSGKRPFVQAAGRVGVFRWLRRNGGPQRIEEQTGNTPANSAARDL